MASEDLCFCSFFSWGVAARFVTTPFMCLFRLWLEPCRVWGPRRLWLPTKFVCWGLLVCKAPSSLENIVRPRRSVRYSKIQKKERQRRAKTRLLERLLEHQGRNIRLLEHPIQQTQGSENRIEIPRVSNGISGPSPLFNQGGGIQKLTYTISIDRASNLFIKRAVLV